MVYGVSFFFKCFLKKRIECELNILLKDFSNLQTVLFKNIFTLQHPVQSDFKKRCVINIFILDLITSYRG